VGVNNNMVTLVKKKIGKKTFYYLRHNVRVKGKCKTVERYLGDKLSKNIEYIMLEFFREIHKKEYNYLEKLVKQQEKGNKKLPKSILEKNLKDFGIRFTYNTNRIEGSTLSLKDTLNLIQEGITPSNRPLSDVKEAENHYKVFMEAINEKRINLNTVLYWHYKIFKDTKPDIAGKIRTYQVQISGSRFIPPSPVELNPLLKDFFRWFNKNINKYHPVELAGIAHFKFVSIHPFGDGNGRISRLIMNWILNQSNYPMYIIPYNKRSRYYSALERGHIKNNPLIFQTWFLKNYIKTLWHK